MVVMRPSDPNDVAAYGESLAEVTIGTPQRLSGRIELCDYDPTWPDAYGRRAARVSAVLGQRVVRLEHVGSTSVPGLPAKPIIDIVLEVPDSSDELAYVSDLEAVGYVLRIREPVWFEHRLFKGSDGTVNLHVFSCECPETDRMVRFRDWLRRNAGDRDLYAPLEERARVARVELRAAVRGRQDRGHHLDPDASSDDTGVRAPVAPGSAAGQTRPNPNMIGGRSWLSGVETDVLRLPARVSAVEGAGNTPRAWVRSYFRFACTTGGRRRWTTGARLSSVPDLSTDARWRRRRLVCRATSSVRRARPGACGSSASRPIVGRMTVTNVATSPSYLRVGSIR
jgi:GrpB-like predicted nucleotidyltransferase (UPF0157 family)